MLFPKIYPSVFQVPQYFVIYIAFTTFLLLGSIGELCADESFTVNSSQNKTIRVLWTVGDTEEHVLKCIGNGDPKPTLKWRRDTEESFPSDEYLQVDTSNPNEISIKFLKIDYEIINDYFCMATTSFTNGTTSTSVSYFQVLVETPRSRATVAGWVIFLGVFIIGATFLCRTLRLNDLATKLDL